MQVPTTGGVSYTAGHGANISTYRACHSRQHWSQQRKSQDTQHGTEPSQRSACTTTGGSGLTAGHRARSTLGSRQAEHRSHTGSGAISTHSTCHSRQHRSRHIRKRIHLNAQHVSQQTAHDMSRHSRKRIHLNTQHVSQQTAQVHG